MSDSVSQSAPRPLVRRALGKARRVLRQNLRGAAAPKALDQQQLEELWHWVNGMQQTVNGLGAQMGDVQQRTDVHANETAEHVDLIVDQLWRRLEAADARLATQVQHLAETYGRKLADLELLSARLRIENASVLRLIGHEEAISSDTDESVREKLPLAHMTLFSEVERGSSEVLINKLQQYVKYFEMGPVIDLGCGKGDFLSLLRDVNIEGYGVDLDDDAVGQAKERGLDARLEDLFLHLKSLPENALGGVFSSQVVEHLPADTITSLYAELFRVVRPGGRVIIETPNPATFATHVQSFWRDPTHIRPVPQPALDFAGRSAGFVTEQTVYASPMAAENRLQPIELEPHDPVLLEVVARFNHNVETLNDVLFGFQDYALISRKP